MSYSDKNPAWHRMHRDRSWQELQAEVRRAREIQQQTGCRWSEALRIVAKKESR